jgi:ATP-binding cassette subfamily F protein 3
VARTAKVRERKLERLLESTNVIENPDRPWGLAVDLQSPAQSGSDVVIANALSLSYGDRVLFSDLDLAIRSGERVAITGPNGAGKSSLLRIIADQIPPTAGELRLGTGVRPGYLGQEQESLSPDVSALDHIRGASPGYESEARGFLHKFLFTGDNVLRPARELSYGERARLSLALIVRKAQTSYYWTSRSTIST